MKKRLLATLLISVLGIISAVGCGKTTDVNSSVTSTADSTTSEESTKSEGTNLIESEEGGLEAPLKIEDYHYTGEKIDINLGTLAGGFVFEIAQEKGFFDKYFSDDNINITINVVQGNGTNIAQALAADEVDIGLLGEQPAIAGIAGGYDLKIIAKNMNSKSFYPFLASSASGVTKLEDLKGKKVGVVYGTSLHFLTYRYLQEAGLTEDDVEFIQTTDIKTLLLSGDIDAGVTTSFSTASILNDGGALLADEDDFEIRQESVLAGRTGFIEKYPELTAKLLLALNEADQWINENKEEAIKIAAKYWDYSEDIEKTYVENNNIQVVLTEEDIASLSDILDFLNEHDVLSQNETLDDVLDLHYLELAGLR